MIPIWHFISILQANCNTVYDKDCDSMFERNEVCVFYSKTFLIAIRSLKKENLLFWNKSAIFKDNI